MTYHLPAHEKPELNKIRIPFTYFEHMFRT
jgi:hypothetical protein